MRRVYPSSTTLPHVSLIFFDLHLPLACDNYIPACLPLAGFGPLQAFRIDNLSLISISSSVLRTCYCETLRVQVRRLYRVSVVRKSNDTSMFFVFVLQVAGTDWQIWCDFTIWQTAVRL